MWRRYRRTGVAEMRDATQEDSRETISVSLPDSDEWDGPRNGKVARNPKNHKDQWYVAAKYFADNFEEIIELDFDSWRN